MSAEMFIGEVGMVPTKASIEAMTSLGPVVWRTRLSYFRHVHYEATTVSTGGPWHYELKFTAFDEVNWARFARRQRRKRGYNPETPARSAMHGAYRAKTRRRGRK